MGDKIDEVIDSMTPAELAALEGEIDKRSSEAAVNHYFERGRELAREAFAQYEKTGELPPTLHIAKSVIEAAEINQFLDKCSAEDLVKIEADLDETLESKKAEEVAAFYYSEGVKLAQAFVKKEAARGAMGIMDTLKGAVQASMKKSPVGTSLGLMGAGALVAPAVGRVFGGNDRR